MRVTGRRKQGGEEGGAEPSHSAEAPEQPAPDETDQLALGITAGFDPQPVDDALDADGTALTNPSSWWNHRICTTCGQSFRRGDRVRVDSDRRVVHMAAELHCGNVSEDSSAAESADAGGVSAEASSEQLARGIRDTWPVSVEVRELTAADWRVRRPEPGEMPATCLFCGHTFRAGEIVVVCPCQLSPACGAAVHRDPAAGLSCWERWRPQGRLSVCPVTLRRIGG